MAHWNKSGLKLVSDGTAMGTRLLLADGTSIPCIKKIEMTPVHPDGFVDVVVTFGRVDLDIELGSSSGEKFEKPSA